MQSLPLASVLWINGNILFLGKKKIRIEVLVCRSRATEGQVVYVYPLIGVEFGSPWEPCTKVRNWRENNCEKKSRWISLLVITIPSLAPGW